MRRRGDSARKIPVQPSRTPDAMGYRTTSENNKTDVIGTNVFELHLQVVPDTTSHLPFKKYVVHERDSTSVMRVSVLWQARPVDTTTTN